MSEEFSSTLTDRSERTMLSLFISLCDFFGDITKYNFVTFSLPYFVSHKCKWEIRIESQDGKELQANPSNATAEILVAEGFACIFIPFHSFHRFIITAGYVMDFIINLFRSMIASKRF